MTSTEELKEVKILTSNFHKNSSVLSPFFSEHLRFRGDVTLMNQVNGHTFSDNSWKWYFFDKRMIPAYFLAVVGLNAYSTVRGPGEAIQLILMRNQAYRTRSLRYGILSVSCFASIAYLSSY